MNVMAPLLRKSEIKGGEGVRVEHLKAPLHLPPVGCTHRIYTINPHYQFASVNPESARSWPGWGVITLGVPGGGGFSDPWSGPGSSKPPRFADDERLEEGVGEGCCDGGVDRRGTPAPHSTPPEPEAGGCHSDRIDTGNWGGASRVPRSARAPAPKGAGRGQAPGFPGPDGVTYEDSAKLSSSRASIAAAAASTSHR